MSNTWLPYNANIVSMSVIWKSSYTHQPSKRILTQPFETKITPIHTFQHVIKCLRSILMGMFRKFTALKQHKFNESRPFKRIFAPNIRFANWNELWKAPDLLWLLKQHQAGQFEKLFFDICFVFAYVSDNVHLSWIPTKTTHILYRNYENHHKIKL